MATKSSTFLKNNIKMYDLLPEIIPKGCIIQFRNYKSDI